MRNSIIVPRITPNHALTKKTGNTYYTRSPAYNLGASHSDIDSLLDAIVEVPIKRHREKYRRALQTIAINLFFVEQAKKKLESGTYVGVTFPRTKNYYCRGSRYRIKNIAFQPVINILDGLENKGLLRLHRGYKRSNWTTGVLSTSELTQSGQSWLQDVIQECTPIELDTNAEIIYLNNNDHKNIEYKDTKETLKLRSELQTFNQWLCKHKVTYIDNETSELITPLPFFLRYVRRFRNNFKSGGRLYSTVQVLRKTERRTLQFNGEDTVELDFKSLHLRLLYNMSGLPSPHDCYKIDGISRSMAKQVALVCLNTKSYESACKALRKHYKDKPYDDIKQAIKALIDAHPSLEEHFFTETWTTLHYWDSSIAFAIMKSFQQKDIPIIGIHDSFVVPATAEDELRDTMNREYKALANYDPIISRE
ncbi:hypothetical protein [Zooshikella ganghwensis]|uniref:Uncharacterized protein n=1 Tax=Zooshikella ganghwensis TaxID=202772 RepID=A0A4P9VHL4_9GAMM|nr:hypothetical protein [Zooshikella ganghwensis]RDH41986.1 hypothetical protein B9G39_00175 [Zooshikella ganghwensis]